LKLNFQYLETMSPFASPKGLLRQPHNHCGVFALAGPIFQTFYNSK